MNTEKMPVSKTPFSMADLVTAQEVTVTTLRKLKRTKLSALSPGITLRLCVGTLTLFVHRADDVQVRVLYQVDGDHPWATKYGVEEMARAMNDAAMKMPAETQPLITASMWAHPNIVSWEFSLPRTTTGNALVKAVTTSINSIKILALGSLMTQSENSGKAA